MSVLRSNVMDVPPPEISAVASHRGRSLFCVNDPAASLRRTSHEECLQVNRPTHQHAPITTKTQPYLVVYPARARPRITRANGPPLAASHWERANGGPLALVIL